MSSILEALKKLEDEKAARLSGAGNIPGKVVKAGRRPRQRPWWLVPAGMAAVAASAVLVTYLLMSGFSTRNETARAPAASAPQQPHQIAAPAAAAPTSPSSPAVTDNEAFPDKRGRTTSPALSPAVHPARQVSPPVTTPRQPETRTIEEPAAPPQQITKPGPSDIPALIVSGIAWQKGGAERFAMVNGRPVAEGATVDGARVEEIFPDRVRFSFANRTFEVSLGKTSGGTP
jgi:general secretion pathway protein B